MLNQEEVTWAYRLLLGREPESEAVVNHYATNLANRAALRSLFMQSAEFQAVAQNLSPVRQLVVLNGKPMPIEWSAPAEKLAALFAKVSQQWHHQGETEPHWSVITSQSYLQSNIAQSAPAFYASGVAELEVLDAALARVGLARQHFDACIELGCGVDRVTAALARRCGQVWGVDISANHLKLAANHMAAQSLTNVQLHQAKDVDDVAPSPVFDLFYSRIVLQHNPPPVMHRMLALLLGKLSPDGIAYFQLPTYKAGYHFSIDSYLATDNATSMEMHYLPQQVLFQLLQQCQCQLLELREDDAIGLSPNAVSNTVLLQKKA